MCGGSQRGVMMIIQSGHGEGIQEDIEGEGTEFGACVE